MAGREGLRERRACMQAKGSELRFLAVLDRVQAGACTGSCWVMEKREGSRSGKVGMAEEASVTIREGGGWPGLVHWHGQLREGALASNWLGEAVEAMMT